jgi:hypothetical protein
MLLATALCGVLLVALWMLMGTYGELFDKGQQQVERAQLCRALLQQMADDLRSAIQDPLPGMISEAAGAAQRRRFGLFGSSRELRFDVLQLTPQQGNPIPLGRAAGEVDETKAARVPELRTVHYTFFEPMVGDEPSGPGQAGLVRSELDFETPLEGAATAGLATARSPQARKSADRGAASSVEPSDAAGGRGSEVGGRDTDPASSVEPSDSESGSADDDTRLSVPEVVSIQFRYFDGRGWTDAWNSLERKSLPAAVEIQLQLADTPAVTAGRPAGVESRTPGGPAVAAAGATDDSLPAADAGVERGNSPRVSATYRLIVDLPGSPSYRPPAIEPQPLVPQPVRPPVRRIAPPRWTRPAETPALPEDWIRTGSR